MDLGSALNSIMEYDIKKHCHINTNEDGDRFVGIKADSDNAMVYFPIGYELPETDAEIRTDIKHLIQVLSEFLQQRMTVYLLLISLRHRRQLIFQLTHTKASSNIIFPSVVHIMLRRNRCISRLQPESRTGQELQESRCHLFRVETV